MFPAIAIQSLISYAESHSSNSTLKYSTKPKFKLQINDCEDKSKEDTQPVWRLCMHIVLASHYCNERVHPLVGIGLLLRLHCHHFISSCCWYHVSRVSNEWHTKDIPKVSGRNSVTYLNQTPILEWYVVKCGLRTDTNKTSCDQKQMGIHAHNLLTILGSIVDEATYMSDWEEYLYFDNE